MNAFEKAFGPKAQARGVIEGEKVNTTPVSPQVDAKMTGQEALAMKMLKTLVPGFDPTVISKLGDNINAKLEAYDAKLTAMHEDIKASHAVLTEARDLIRAMSEADMHGLDDSVAMYEAALKAQGEAHG